MLLSPVWARSRCNGSTPTETKKDGKPARPAAPLSVYLRDRALTDLRLSPSVGRILPATLQSQSVIAIRLPERFRAGCAFGGPCTSVRGTLSRYDSIERMNDSPLRHPALHAASARLPGAPHLPAQCPAARIAARCRASRQRSTPWRTPDEQARTPGTPPAHRSR